MLRSRLSVVVLACFLSACIHKETVIERSQKLVVESDPPGGAVYVVDEAGRSRRGTAPLTIETPYKVIRSEFDGRCWIGAGLGLAAGGVGAYSAYGVSQVASNFNPGDDPLLLVGTIVGLSAGILGVSLAAVCGIEASGEPTETPAWAFRPGPGRDIEVEVPGLAAQRVTVQMPGPDRKLAFRLEPAAGALVAAAPTSATLQPGRPPPASPASGAFAAGAPQPNAFALVIGVEKYRDLPPPTGARGDAQQFAELARKTLGVPDRNVILALDDRAAKSDLEKHLAWLEKNVPAGGRIYLFFAGHGAPDPASGTSYLLPYDADPAALDGTALKLSAVTARLGKTKARDVVAFLDSCFSGTGGRSVIAAGTRPLVPVQKLLAAPKVSILAAVTGAQTSGAWSGGGGLFSHFLLQAIGTGRADHDGDGQITLREVSEWIGTRVENEARRDSREQLPSLTPGAGVDPGQAVLAIGVSGG